MLTKEPIVTTSLRYTHGLNVMIYIKKVIFMRTISAPSHEKDNPQVAFYTELTTRAGVNPALFVCMLDRIRMNQQQGRAFAQILGN